jgi:O-antigen/teichoic acid export membrane protein
VAPATLGALLFSIMASKTAAGKILHNSFWYGLEAVLETVVFLGTSVAVARYLGPTKLGYFSYINFFVMIVNRTSGTGLASATRKYMSEFIGQDQPGIACAVYHFAYRYQLIGAVAVTALGLLGVAIFGDPSYRLMAAILILSIVPGVMSWVPAQANQAFEDTSKNSWSAFGYILSYAFIVFLSIHYRWDLIGIAAASLVGRSVEVVWRTIPLHAALRKIPISPLPEELRLRMRGFCIQAIGIQIITSIVWDRSEMVFLRVFSSLQQIAFYSISFGLANNLLLIPRIFGAATGITLMVESSRDPRRIGSIITNACRYLFLVVFPVHLGAAAITRQVISLSYGRQYQSAVPVLIVASILAIPRAFAEIPDILMRAFERQNELLRWMIVTGVVNIALDVALIPHYGAVGAAWANGLAQSFCVVVLWIQARRICTYDWPTRAMVRLFAAALIMAFCAYGIGRAISGVRGLAVAIVFGVLAYTILVKLFRGLESEDSTRLGLIGKILPGALSRPYLAIIAFVIPANAALLP